MTHSATGLLVLGAFLGLGQGAGLPSLTAYAASSVSNEKRGAAINTFTLGGDLAMSVGALSLGFVAAQSGTTVAFVIAGLSPVLAIAFFIYVAVTAAFIPLATTMSFVYAWIFGFWTTLVLVSFASTAGATLAFLLSRHLIGKTIQKRFSDQLVKFNQAIEREGAFYLFLLRLTPALPYFVVNAVMGLTKLRIRTFWWVSQLGMLPGTCIYVYAGSRFPQGDELADKGMASILKPEIIIAFVLLGVFPLVIRRLVTRLRTKTE
ncbi:MAG: VTT domain-containing protein [Planctomycetes bacterium]|nr:VTT domain-containing protein [Planctomycetota bacterium]